jgi:hypothetical protein
MAKKCYFTHAGVKCPGVLFPAPPNIGIPAQCTICDRCGAVHQEDGDGNPKPWFPPEHPASKAKMNDELRQRIEAVERQNVELLNRLARQPSAVTPGAAQQPGVGAPVPPAPEVAAGIVKDPVP